MQFTDIASAGNGGVATAAGNGVWRSSRPIRGESGSGMSRMAGSMRTVGRLGLLSPFKLGQRVAGRRVLAGI